MSDISPPTQRNNAPRISPLSEITLADIPPRVGLFPLKGGLLLPRGQLPLRVFESHYTALVENALANYRLIGMIQPVGRGRNGIGTPALEQMGTLGRITSFLERSDGTFSLTLTGVCRFHLLRDQITGHGWREGMIDASAFTHDLLESAAIPLDRNIFTEALKRYFDHHHLKTNWKNLESLNDEALLTALPMILPLDAKAKQALLEANGLDERALLLLDILNQDFS